MRSKLFLFFVVSLLFSVTSCTKDGIITGSEARLSLSRDSIKFDTVFTSAGSITQSFKIINTNDKQLRISLIQLEGGASSAFRININGEAVLKKEDVLLRANDSIYVFVTVFVQPTQTNQPFILSDSIRLLYNGNTRFVQLQAYGQNAIYLDGQTFNSDTVFSSLKPYVILNSLRVGSNATLTLPANTKMYMHANAPIIIDGTLKALGQKNAEVSFASDRLDDPYRDYPGGWPGIIFTQTSKNNYLNFCLIKNAYQAIVADRPAPNPFPKLIIEHTIISNAYDAGLLCSNSSVQMSNSLIQNCGTNIGIIAGGVYDFTNCTIAGYSSLYFPHLKESVTILNYSTASGTIVSNNCTANFTNCIIWGEDGIVKNELIVDKKGSSLLNVLLDHCIYKAEMPPSNTTFLASIPNTNPLFDSINVGQKKYDFHISNPAAPGINTGKIVPPGVDLDNKNRTVGITDIGCYEQQ